jgi:hypothetical protein
VNKHGTQAGKALRDKLAEARTKLHEMTKDLPQREWKPYVVPQAMREAMKRVEEYKALPSRFA